MSDGADAGAGLPIRGGSVRRRKPRARRAPTTTPASTAPTSTTPASTTPASTTPASTTPAVHEADASVPSVSPASRSRGQRQVAPRVDHSERQWRELAGSGRSQLSLDAALRARDADQPTSAELAEAERDTIVQRRNWVPTKPG